MAVADRRHHGDIFPLPARTVQQLVDSSGVDYSQRAYWISHSLNKLALHDKTNSTSQTILCSELPLTSTQSSVAERICQSLKLHGDCHSDCTPESALSSLCGGKPSYDGVPNNLAPYDPNKLKILSKGASPRHVLQFLPPEAAAIVRDFRRSILRQPQPDIGRFSPYWDPVLRHSRTTRLDFVVRLFRAGLMTLRPVASSFVGAFCVRKKDPAFIRLVIDCRGTNLLHQDPPTTRLGSARCYGDLDFSAGSGCTQAFGQEADVADCFYRFSLPELADYFAINEPLPASQWQSLGIECRRVFDPSIGNDVSTTPDQILFPCFAVVPMGWTWALWICNEAVVRVATASSPWNDGILREKKPTPQLSDFKTLVGVYVDNITILGSNKQDVSVRATALQDAFDRAGIPITWSQAEPTDVLESVGLVLNLRDSIVMNKPARVWKFFQATRALLRRRKLKGDLLQIWTGHYTSLCGITPYGLSALNHTYRFIQASLNKRITVWPVVRHELKICASLVWLTWKRLDSTVMSVVEVGDSATSGYAMMACKPPEHVVKQAMKIHEKWRFIPMPSELKQCVEDQNLDAFSELLGSFLGADDVDSLSVACKCFRPAGLSTSYAQHVFESVKEGSFLATSGIRSQLRAKPNRRLDIEIPALVEPVDSFFTNKDNFRLLWARRWKDHKEHISLKEGRVALSSLRRSSRVRSAHHCKKLTLCDNLPALLAFSKGRSSNPRMNNLCRAAAAIQFSCGITWHVRHIETKRNIADGPSRLFETSSWGSRDRRAYRVHCEGSESSGFSREASAPSKPLVPRREHVDAVFPNPQGRYFLEIFSGTGHLTDAVAKCGLPILEPLDYINGPHCDLRRRRTQELVLSWIDRGIIGFVHLGTPCTIWSRARHNVKDSASTRHKEEVGIELALFSSEVIRRCIAHGVPYVLENPRSSKLFMFEPLVTSICQGPNRAVDFEMCQFGEPYQKRTRVVTSVDWLDALARRCNHKTHDTWLKGQVKVLSKAGKPIYVNRTALAGAYPHEFCRVYAQLIAKHANLKHDSDNQVPVVWSSSLRSVAKHKTRATKYPKHTISQESAEQSQQLHLLAQQGGLSKFLDAIALGRSSKEAWQALKKRR